MFSASAPMFIFPSSQVLGIGMERARATAAEVPAGADVDAAKAAARRKAAPRTEERVATALLDSGASGRNFISSSLASWLRVRGSAVSAEAGETGLAQAGSKIQFHESIEFGVRFFNLNTKVFEILTLRASVIENLRIDLLLSLQTVGKHKLLPKLKRLCVVVAPLALVVVVPP